MIILIYSSLILTLIEIFCNFFNCTVFDKTSSVKDVIANARRCGSNPASSTVHIISEYDQT
jgi:hypothetical protein